LIQDVKYVRAIILAAVVWIYHRHVDTGGLMNPYMFYALGNENSIFLPYLVITS
jgi:hypothetical protein